MKRHSNHRTASHERHVSPHCGTSVKWGRILNGFAPFLAVILSCLTLQAANIITATITVTNTPVAANTLTVGASVRTWRASVTIPATEFLIGGSVGGSATNLYNQIAANPYTPSMLLGFSSTNVITLRGNPGVALGPTASGTWCTITLSTNTSGGEYDARLPMAALSNQARTNEASHLVTGMSDYSQASFGATATALANHVNLSQSQTITGSKTFNGNLNTHTNASIELYLSNLDFFTNSVLRFFRGAYIQFDTNVWILDQYGNTNWAFSTIAQSNKVAVLLDITNAVTALKAANNGWTGSNNFTLATGTLSNIVGYVTSPLRFDNGSALASDPTAAVNLGSVSGELEYRASTASEGAGQANRVHNRTSKIAGTGANFPIPDLNYNRVDFGGTDPQIVLPTAGTYLVWAVAEITAGANCCDTWSLKLYNSTDAADVTDSEVRRSNIIETTIDELLIPQTPVTVTVTKTIQLYVRNQTTIGGSVVSTGTRIYYVRLY